MVARAQRDRYERPEELYARESELWGRAAGDEGGRSAIELRVGIEQAGKIDSSKIRLQRSKEGEATPGAYALWPAREEKKENRPTAPRRTPGTTFLLALTAPSAHIQDLENAVRAWLLFGGYGSRTRRGLGSFRVLDAPRAWLPCNAATRQEPLSAYSDAISSPHQEGLSNDVPRLAGAALHVGHAQRDAQTAWKTALEWLKNSGKGPAETQVAAQGNRRPMAALRSPTGPNQTRSDNCPDRRKACLGLTSLATMASLPGHAPASAFRLEGGSRAKAASDGQGGSKAISSVLSCSGTSFPQLTPISDRAGW